MSRDLAGSIIAARRVLEALVSERATRGTDMEPAYRSEADTRLRELANARGFILDPIEEPTNRETQGAANV